jgi:hypothetical protein
MELYYSAISATIVAVAVALSIATIAGLVYGFYEDRDVSEAIFGAIAIVAGIVSAIFPLSTGDPIPLIIYSMLSESQNQGQSSILFAYLLPVGIGLMIGMLIVRLIRSRKGLLLRAVCFANAFTVMLLITNLSLAKGSMADYERHLRRGATDKGGCSSSRALCQ